jgi:hypothetical protein
MASLHDCLEFAVIEESFLFSSRSINRGTFTMKVQEPVSRCAIGRESADPMKEEGKAGLRTER